MARRCLIFLLAMLTAVTTLAWAVTLWWPYWYSGEIGSALLRVLVADGTIEVSHTHSQTGRTINHAIRRHWGPLCWERRDDVRSHGYWFVPGSPPHYLRVRADEEPPGHAVYVQPSFVREYRVRLPLAPLIAAFASVPALVFCGRRVIVWSRRRRGVCLSCRYDLTGNVSGVCPECGRALVRGG